LPLLLAPAREAKLFHSGNNQILCALWTKAIQNFKSFSLRFIVRDEEPLNLMQQVAVQITQKTNVRVVARICSDGDKAIIARGLLLFRLLGFDSNALILYRVLRA